MTHSTNLPPFTLPEFKHYVWFEETVQSSHSREERLKTLNSLLEAELCKKRQGIFIKKPVIGLPNNRQSELHAVGALEETIGGGSRRSAESAPGDETQFQDGLSQESGSQAVGEQRPTTSVVIGRGLDLDDEDLIGNDEDLPYFHATNA